MSQQEQIPYPNDEHIQLEISKIIQKSIPKQQKFSEQFRTLIKQVGWRNVMPNLNEWICSVVVITLITVLVAVISQYTLTFSPALFVLQFMLSPLLFFVLTAFSFYEKKEIQTFELEMTTKYTIFHLISIRLLMYSGLTIVVNMTMSFLMASKYELSVVHLLLVSLTSLFLFATILLVLLKTGRILNKFIGLLIGWVIVNLLATLVLNDEYILVLITLPVIVYLGILSVLVALFCLTFKGMFLRKQEGVFIC